MSPKVSSCRKVRANGNPKFQNVKQAKLVRSESDFLIDLKILKANRNHSRSTLWCGKAQEIVSNKKQREHSSRMCTTRLSTLCALVAPRCQYKGGGPEVKKFEQISSDGHQMPLAGVGALMGGSMSGEGVQ